MYVVRKIHKRIYVLDDFDTELPKFTAPDWLKVKVPDRKAYQDLADEINSGKHYVDAIVDFYGKWNKDR